MSISLTRAKLQTLHASISGVKSAPTSYPASLKTAQLPLVLVWPDQGEWQSLTTSAMRRQDRVYLVRVYFDAVAQGSPDKPPPGIEDMLQAFGAAYVDPANADQSASGYQAVIMGEGITDSGLGVLNYAGIPYHGFEFRVSVYEKW